MGYLKISDTRVYDKDKYTDLVLFDGVCNLCNHFIQFIIVHDPKAVFSFASLQSDAGKEIIKGIDFKKGIPNSVIYIREGSVFTKSTAALLISKKLNNGLSFFWLLLIVPVFIRDFIYDFVALHRYKWFGRKEACWLPTPELLKRFIDK